MGLSLPKSNLIFLKKCLDKWVHFRLSDPYLKKSPTFFKKRLTNRSKFAAKPIDYILFQSTGGDFYVTL